MLLGVLAVSCRNDAQDVRSRSNPDTGPAVVQYGIRVVYSDTSDTYWKLRADTLIESRTSASDLREIFQGNVRAEQHRANKATGTELRANRIVRDAAQQVWELSGSVLVRKGSRKTLRTESMNWDRNTGIVSGEGWVEITDDGQILRGHGFEAAEDLSVYSIFEVSGSGDPN